MPDFANQRDPKKRLPVRTEKVRELITPKQPEKSRTKGEEHPITALRRALKDFSAAAALLKKEPLPAPAAPRTQTVFQPVPGKVTERVTERVIEKPGTHTHSTETRRHVDKVHTRSNHKPVAGTNPLTAANLHRQNVSASTTAATPVAAQRAPTPEAAARAAVDGIKAPTPIRMPSRRSITTRSRGVASTRVPVTGADREARRHFQGTMPENSPHNLPSAARLAQILRADQLMRTGEIKANPAVQGWANAIQAGKRREIADLDPEQVEKVLHQSLGGAAAAERLLNTPEIQKLIERHTSTLSNIHNNLRETEKAIARTHTATSSSRVSTRGGANTRTHTAERSTSVAERIYGTAAAPAHAAGGTEPARVEAELSNMLATNEEPHLYAEQSEQHELMGASARSRPMEGGAAPAATRNGGPMAEQPRARREIAESMSAPTQRREAASSISAPPPRANASTPGNMTENGKKQGPTELRGRMELTMRGQVVGEARIDAEMR